MRRLFGSKKEKENKQQGEAASKIRVAKDAKLMTGARVNQALEVNEWFYQNFDLNKSEEYATLVAYKGFDRNKVLAQINNHFSQARDDGWCLILAVALRGPVKAVSLRLPSGKTALEYGVGSSERGSDSLTASRMLSAAPDIAALMLHKLNVPPRLDHPLPAYLQFPAAGALRLPRQLRDQHWDWSVKFSDLIGGSFNEQLYMNLIDTIDPIKPVADLIGNVITVHRIKGDEEQKHDR